MLQIENLSYKRGQNEILSNLNFSIEKGEIVGIIGPNGAGKSTLFKILSGLLIPSAGDVKVNNESLFKNVNRNSSMIGSFIETPALYDYLTGREQLELIIKYHDLDLYENINRVAKQLVMSEFIDKKIKSYSLGMKQKMGIASAIVHNPQYIFLDEPTNSLDVTTVIELRNLIAELKRENKGILLSSHIISEIQEICDRVIILNNGIMEEISQFNLKKDKLSSYGISLLINNKDIEMLKQFPYIHKSKEEIEVIIDQGELNKLIYTITSLGLTVKNIKNLDQDLGEIYMERIKSSV